MVITRGSSIIDWVDAGEPFHTRRELALHHPQRARDRLDGYAKLRVKVLEGRNLMSADADGSSDPYVQILINDIEKARTETILKSLNPVWDPDSNKLFELEIKSPATVLMLRVMDHDWSKEDDMLGFVEIPIEDLHHQEVIHGWCSLFPKDALENTAVTRLKNISKTCQERCGAILIDLELRIVSNDPSDENFAWCVPEPNFVNYPKGGAIRRADLNMQKIIDYVDAIQTTLMHRLVGPFRGFVSFVLTWKNFSLSFTVYSFLFAICIFPECCLASIFGMIAVIMVRLRKRRLREIIAADPCTVPLNDWGFELVAKKMNTDDTVCFLDRVIKSLRGTVLDADDLYRFAAFATLEGKPCKRYEELCLDLKTLGREGKLVTFSDKPLESRTLVKCNGGYGEIISCHGKDDCVHEDLDLWRYSVGLGKGKGRSSMTIVRNCSEIVPRLDLRWLANPIVLKFIPDSVEDFIMGFVPTLENLETTLISIASFFEDLFGWEGSTSPRVCISLFVLSLVCNPLILGAWVQKLVLVALLTFVFVSSTSSWIVLFNRRRGNKLAAAHKRNREWGFFSPGPPRIRHSTSDYRHCVATRIKSLAWCGGVKKKKGS